MAKYKVTINTDSYKCAKCSKKNWEPGTRNDYIFVNDCFTLYEKEGFAKKFWTPYDENKQRIGQPFTVVSKCSIENSDLECLPMWQIKFADGTCIDAYPEEIIPSEMRNNGCKIVL